MELRHKKLGLFFSCGISLKIWNKIGILDREIKPYNFLADYFEKIYFITYGGKEDLEFKKDLAKNIEILPKKFSFLPCLIYTLLIPFIYRKELKEIDIYKTNQMTAVIPAILAKWFYPIRKFSVSNKAGKKKLVVRCGYEWLSFLENQKKSWWKRKIAYLIEKIAYQNADKIILTSKKDKNFIIRKFKLLTEKIEIIPNYIDTELFKPLDTKKKKNRIIFIGRLEKEKNLFNLIGAIANLPVKLIIIGKGSLKEKLEKFSKQKNIDVEFKENIPNQHLAKELNQAKIFILPSFYEGCPKTLLEAMACGLPCIGTDAEGINEIIKHKENGYLCEINAKSINKAILEVLEDKILQNKISQNARKTILEKFSLEKILAKELKIYEIL